MVAFRYFLLNLKPRKKMIPWFIYFDCIILPLIVAVHVVALSLLYHRRNKKGCKHQIYAVTSLCICELNGALMFIVYYIVLHKNVSSTIIGICFCYINLFVRLTHYATMTVLAIDRFLVFHLNMRYFILWPPRRMLKSLLLIYFISFAVYLSCVCLIVLDIIDWMYLADFVHLPFLIWDIIYTGMVVATYLYIFHMYKKHMKFNKDQHFHRNKSEHFKLRIPTLLIVTFIIFMCVPDFLNASVHCKLLKGNGQMFYIAGIFYRFAGLTDPVIYIYSCKLFEIKIFRKQRRDTEVTQP